VIAYIFVVDGVEVRTGFAGYFVRDALIDKLVPQRANYSVCRRLFGVIGSCLNSDNAQFGDFYSANGGSLTSLVIGTLVKQNTSTAQIQG
jgi:hypothetical protein